jgi:hypothetical protein
MLKKNPEFFNLTKKMKKVTPLAILLIEHLTEDFRRFPNHGIL